METDELVRAGQTGDMDSYINLIRCREETIYKVARAYTQNSYDAEDCISEAVIHAYDKLGQLRRPEKFYPWFMTILVNICRDKYKRMKNEEEYIPVIHDCIPDTVLKNPDHAIILETIFKHLEQNERDLLALRYLNDFTLEETAGILGIPKGTVKSRLSRTLFKIRSRFGRLFSDEV